MPYNAQKLESANSSADADSDVSQKNQIIAYLQANKWFSELPVNVIEALATDAELRVAALNEPVFTIGQYDGMEVYVLIKGEAQLTSVSPGSGDMCIEQVGAGDCVGIEYVLSGAFGLTGTTALTALEELTFVTLDASRIERLIEETPTFTKNMMKVAALTLTEQRLETPEQENESASRIVAALIELLEKDPTQAGHHIIKKMPKHRELSEMAGVSEEESAVIVARLISDGIARRQYPGLVIEDYTSFKNILNK